MSELTKVVTDAISGEQVTVPLTAEEIAENERSYLEWQKVRGEVKQPTIQDLQNQLLKLQEQISKLSNG